MTPAQLARIRVKLSLSCGLHYEEAIALLEAYDDLIAAQNVRAEAETLPPPPVDDRAVAVQRTTRATISGLPTCSHGRAMRDHSGAPLTCPDCDALWNQPAVPIAEAKRMIARGELPAAVTFEGVTESRTRCELPTLNGEEER